MVDKLLVSFTEIIGYEEGISVLKALHWMQFKFINCPELRRIKCGHIDY